MTMLLPLAAAGGGGGLLAEPAPEAPAGTGAAPGESFGDQLARLMPSPVPPPPPPLPTPQAGAEPGLGDGESAGTTAAPEDPSAEQGGGWSTLAPDRPERLVAHARALQLGSAVQEIFRALQTGTVSSGPEPFSPPPRADRHTVPPGLARGLPTVAADAAQERIGLLSQPESRVTPAQPTPSPPANAGHASGAQVPRDHGPAAEPVQPPGLAAAVVARGEPGKPPRRDADSGDVEPLTPATTSIEAGSSSSTLRTGVSVGLAALSSAGLPPAAATARAMPLPLADPPAALPTAPTQVTVPLDPAAGGGSRIRIALRGDVVHATILADVAVAGELVRRLPELHRALRERGFSDAQVAVRVVGAPAIGAPTRTEAASAEPRPDESHAEGEPRAGHRRPTDDDRPRQPPRRPDLEDFG